MNDHNPSLNGDIKDNDYNPYLERNIHFWKIEIIKEDGNKKIELNPWDVVSHFNSLIYDRTSEESRYIQFLPKRYDVVIDVKKDKDGIIDIVFGRIKQTNLPHIELKGKKRPILLEVDEGLFVISHIQIHPDGVILKESVGEGPSMPAFRRYILKRNNLDVKEVKINRIAHEDFIRLLPLIEEVKFMNIAVARKMTRELSSLDNTLAGLFSAAQDWADFEEWTIGATMKESKRKPPILRSFWNRIKEAMMKEDLRKKLERFRVGVRLAGEDETRIFDLLHAHLSDELLVKRMDQDSKNSDSNDIAKKMKNMYTRRKPKEGDQWLLVVDEIARDVQETLDAD